VRFRNVAVDAAVCVLPPRAVSSAAIEERLAPVYDRLRLPYGRLEMMSGIRERRFWEPGTRPSTVAAEAGRSALVAAEADPGEIGLLIHASVCRDFLEPATAAVVHENLGLPPTAELFDLGNACLGVLSGMSLAATWIEAGRIDAALIVAGEVAEPLHEATVKRLLADRRLTREGMKKHFASLTIGSGAAAVLLRRAEASRTGLRLLGGANRTDSRANRLCREDVETDASEDGPLMATDAEALLHAGCALAAETWAEAKEALGWTDETPDRVFTHQVGTAHRRMLFDALGLAMEKDYPTLEKLGNTGSVALPTAFALGLERGAAVPGQRLALLGIGSGLVSSMLGLEWTP
jgi:3-oxoacyl-[acyl-carrier-protein] synthase-3